MADTISVHTRLLRARVIALPPGGNGTTGSKLATHLRGFESRVSRSPRSSLFSPLHNGRELAWAWIEEAQEEEKHLATAFARWR
jgi:hypothetical protein